jgi:hypothetical protein
MISQFVTNAFCQDQRMDPPVVSTEGAHLSPNSTSVKSRAETIPPLGASSISYQPQIKSKPL